MALHDMPAESVGRAKRQFEVDLGALLSVGQRTSRERLVHDVGAERPGPSGQRRQADPTDSDRLPGIDLVGEVARNGDARSVAPAVDPLDSAQALDDARKHLTYRPSSNQGSQQRVIAHHSLSRADTSKSSPNLSHSTERACAASAIVSTPSPSSAERAVRPPSTSGATNSRSSSISPASRNAPAR